MVIAIIGILATVVVTQLGKARVSARNAQAKGDITEIGKAIEAFKNDDAAAGNVISASTTTAPTYGAASITYSVTAAGVYSSTFSPSLASPPANASFPGIFTGKANTTNGSASYALSISKVPNSQYQYIYTTDAKTTAQTFDNKTSKCYVISTPADNTSGVTDKSFYVQDGSAGSGSGPGVPPIVWPASC